MKTLEELKKLREKAKQQIKMRTVNDGFRIQVGMGTCGIAAGARPILNAFYEQINHHGLKNITITQVGCMGNCMHEPMAEIIDNNGQSYIYSSLTIPKVQLIVERHLVNHQPVDSFLLINSKGNIHHV
jgi:NADP-reducing hydrogenase subunit HndB